MAQRKPNVIVLMPHDAGQHISPYGIDTVNTPNCERLAAEGVLFENSFCTSPLCSPSRASCFTGRHTHQNGVMGLTSPRTGRFDLYPEEQHAAELFGNAGYDTCLCGFLHETNDLFRVGFQEAINGAGRGNNWGGDFLEAGADIDRWLSGRDPKKPFYLQIGCGEVHRGWDGYEPDDSRGVWMPPYLRDVPELRSELAQLQGALKQYDTGLGRILDVLKEHDLREDTIFVSTTDHGIDIPRAKGTFYDPGIEVILIMRYPAGGWEAGGRRTELVSNVDVLPTLLEACGLEVPARIEGRSFLPLLEGGDYEPREWIFAEKIYHDTYDPTRAIRTRRYKYIRYFAVCIFQDLRIATIPRWDYFKERPVRDGVEELYDLESDPWEEKNLADEPEYEEVKNRLRRRLADWMRETDDPLLEGPIPSPYYERKMQEFLET